jgi:hypothetical protein
MNILEESYEPPHSIAIFKIVLTGISRKEFEWNIKNNTPAYAVLITFLNLSIRWVPCCCFRLSTSRRYGMLADMLTANKERPPVQGVGSKNEY